MALLTDKTTEKDLDEAIEIFERRNRKFGGK